MAEPTLVAYSQSDWSDNALIVGETTAASFTWQVGDVFHVLGATEDSGLTLNTPTTAGANLTFSLIDSTAGANNTATYYWRGTASGDGSGTITAANGEALSGGRGIAVWQYRSTSGQGTPVKITGQNAKTMSVTRGGANSHIIQVMADWNETGDVTTDPTPATNATQRVELAISGAADFFVTDWGDQGGTGTTSYGITNHTGTVDMSGITVEILGVAGGAINTKTMTEAVTLTDVALNNAIRVRRMDESISVADPQVWWLRRVRLLSEAIDAADSFVKSIGSGAGVFVKVMTDLLSPVDSAVQWLRRVRGPIDSVLLTDGDTYRTAFITASESIDLVDSTVKIARFKRVMDENIDIIDVFSKILAGAGIVYAKVMSDTITLIDDAGRRWKLRTSRLSETIGLSDQVLDYLRAVRVLGDVVEYSDGTVKISRTVRTMTEGIEITDGTLSTLYLDNPSNVQFTFGSSAPPFRFGGF